MCIILELYIFAILSNSICSVKMGIFKGEDIQKTPIAIVIRYIRYTGFTGLFILVSYKELIGFVGLQYCCNEFSTVDFK